jgi:hypothetical protein
MPVPDDDLEDDEYDREQRIALAAAQTWLAGKPPAVWLWLQRQQEANHDEYGILEWMETRPELAAARAAGLPQSADNRLPPEFEHHRDPATWDFFRTMAWTDCPRPGSKAYAAWLQHPPPLARRLFPDLFPETAVQKARRYLFAALCLVGVVAGTYACVMIRLG